MRERVAKIIGPSQAKKIVLSTFHSFCMQILRAEIHHLGYTKQFTLYDEKDVKRLIKQLAAHILEHEGELPSLETTMAKITYAKSRGLNEEEMPESNSKWHDTFSKELYGKLSTCMRAYNAVDFDSL